MPTSKTAPRRTVVQVQKEFDDFKKQVVDVAWNFEGGCYEGKVDFLEELGLPIPIRKARLKVELEMDVSGEFNEYEITDNLNNIFNGIAMVTVNSLELWEWLD